MPTGTRLYVGNLPYDASEQQIAAFVEQAGKRQVTQVKIVMDRETGRPRGFAFPEHRHHMHVDVRRAHGQRVGRAE